MRMIDTICPACGDVRIDHAVVDLRDLPDCHCGTKRERFWISSASVRPDSIPGGFWAEHGICHEDGTPKRYDSRTEIRDACAAKGWMPWGEVWSEDRTKDARVRADWQQSTEAKTQKRWRDEARKEQAISKAKAAAEVTA